MNLREVRIEFIKRCGRYDLVTPDDPEDEWGDNGANFYIQSGQRYLDRQGDWDTGQIGTFRGGLAKGEAALFVPNLWGVSSVRFRLRGWPKGVWHSVEGVHSLDALKCRCPKEPLYYFKPLRKLPVLRGKTAAQVEQPASSFDLSAGVVEAEIEGAWLQFTGLPNQEPAVEVMVVGHFHSAALKEDEDSNYWTNLHPEILIKAALYELEIFYRNREGAADWLAAVQEDLLTLQQQELFTSINAQPSEMGL